MIAVHVIEKAGGVPDKASVEQRRNNARRIFAAVDETFDGSPTVVETEIRYGTAIAQAIVDAANEHSASAIVFSPRRGGRWVRLLTGDIALSLLTESSRPVIVLPGELDETVSDGSVAVSESASTDTGRTARIDADERDAADSAENDENSDS